MKSNKSRLVLVLLIIFFISLILIMIYWQLNSINSLENILFNKNQPVSSNQNFSKISGVVVLNPDYEIEAFENQLSVSKLTSKYMILDSSDYGNPKYYVMDGFNNIEIEKRFSNLTVNDLARYCIELAFSEKNNKVLDPSLEFFNQINFVTVQDFQILTDLSCYPTYSAFKRIDENITLPGKYQINVSQRPAYDIGYDYAIAMPYAQATKLGYIDSAGYSQEERSKINNGNVNIILTFNGSEVLKQAELARRAGKAAKITGTFDWGYAETMYFDVDAISF